MADSLFDGRYRYNYIYPRGRSGETLRAVDTFADDMPVVIKRPAPNDAPPIRAGQEVSIINERDALTRLAGHPALTELVGSGQFFVGGIPHQYIVMERAEGIIIADEVARLAARSERLPELEMLEIIDRLINLLQAAHDKDIVYNDVDAKHLFWNRDAYTLKVIDWGNAVFLEGDEATSQGISRQTDVYQVGELLFFILSGGRRVDIPRDAGHDFKLDFHQDSDSVNQRLQDIVSKAVHPSARHRYASLHALNADLVRFRAPLEQVRNAIVSRAINKLKSSSLSRSELLSLKNQLSSAQRQNPAYPVVRAAQADISDRLRDLEVSADLDAVKIYISSGSWTRAAELLDDMLERAGPKTIGIVRLLLDWSTLLIDAGLDAIPPAITESAMLLFEFKPEKAAKSLMIDGPEDSAIQGIHWRMAERITARFPDILLLRPNISRVDEAIQQLEAEGLPTEELSAITQSINRALQKTTANNPSAPTLRDSYGEIVEALNSLDAHLQSLSLKRPFSERHLPFNALARARKAAMALADNMRVIGKQAANNPREALTALDNSRAIDPSNPAWEHIEDFLSHLFEILKNSQSFVPAADGSNLENWLRTTHEAFRPFARQLFDDSLDDSLDRLKSAEEAWARYREVVVAGSKIEAIQSLSEAAAAVSTLSPTLANWFNQLRSVIDGANYIERHSVPGYLGRALADGWAAFDNGQLADAERLGQQAQEIARSDSEQAIGERLYQLSRVLREWVERNGIESESRSEKALLDIERLFTDAEEEAISDFANQMPSNDTYLKAMGQGLAQAFGDSNTASLRILFAQYVLSGALDAHEGIIKDARFWRAAALRALPQCEDRQPAMRALDDFIERRVNLLDAQNLLDTVNSIEALEHIDDIVEKLEANPQAQLLAPAVHSLSTLKAALQDWSSAEFRAAGQKTDQALRAAAELESNANIKLPDYRAWLMELQTALAELSVKGRALLQDIDRQPDEPQARVRDVIRDQAEITLQLLGQNHAQTLLGWRDSYEQFLSIYSADMPRRQKLADMDELFKALFIERNPAYPLFRHWYRLIENAPDEPVSAPEPLLEAADEEPSHPSPDAPPKPLSEVIAQASDPPKKMRPRTLSIAAAVLGLILIVGGLYSLAAGISFEHLMAAVGLHAQSSPTPTPLPQEPLKEKRTVALNLASELNEDLDDEAQPTQEPSPTAAIASDDAMDDADSDEAESDIPASAMPTETDMPRPTATDPPTATPTDTQTPQPTATATLPPEGLKGPRSILEIYSAALDEPFWNAERFSQQDGTWRLGIFTETIGETIFLFPPPELLNSRYGNDAPSRISRIEAELTLHSYDPAVVSSEEVVFGILFQSTSGGQNAGIQVQAIGPTSINLATYRDNEARVLSQRSVNAMIARLRLERDPLNEVVYAYFNDAPIGAGIPFVAPDAEVVPVIFVKDGGVIIGISSWDITLR